MRQLKRPLFVLILASILFYTIYFFRSYVSIRLQRHNWLPVSTLQFQRQGVSYLAKRPVNKIGISFSIKNDEKSCRNDTELIVVVITSVRNFEDRHAIRHTWAADIKTDTTMALVFMVGLTTDDKFQTRLSTEHIRYKDIIQVDFFDSYLNLSLKSLAMLKWVTTHCNHSRFLLKADDDTYINLSLLHHALKKLAKQQTDFIVGHVFSGVKPIIDHRSKWYTPLNQYNRSTYPRYVSGTAYAMTTSASRRLLRSSAEVPLFWLEDVYTTGICAQKAHVKLIHNKNFSFRKNKIDGCSFRKFISVHGYNATEKQDIFKLLHNKSIVCIWQMCSWQELLVLWKFINH